MVAPTVLPGRSFQRIDRVSRLLFHWRARDLSLTPVTGETPAFARASAGGAVVDRNGLLSIPVHSQPRFEMVDVDADGLREAAALLLENTSTFQGIHSEDLSAWTLTGAPTHVPGAKTVGAVSLDLVGDTDAGAIALFSSPLVFATDGEKSVAVLVARGTLPPASGSSILVRDTTAPAARLAAAITFSAAGVPAVVMSAGTHLGSEALGNGVYRLLFRTTAVTAVNAHEIEFVPADVSAETGNVYAGAVQVEEGPVPTSYVRTAGGQVTRAADTLTFPYGVPPGAVTGLVRFIETGAVQLGTSPRILQIGALPSTDPRLLITVAGGVYQIEHDNGVATVISAALAAPALGDEVTLRWELFADGSVRLHQSVNGGPEVSGVRSAANTLGAAWSAEQLHAGFARYLELKIGAGSGVPLTDLQETV